MNVLFCLCLVLYVSTFGGSCNSSAPQSREGKRTRVTTGKVVSPPSTRGELNDEDNRDPEGEGLNENLDEKVSDPSRPAQSGVSLDQVRPILSRHCLRCHGARGTNPDLSEDRSIYMAAKAIVRSSGTRFNGMPKDNPASISQQEKDVLNAWQAGGFK